MFVYAINIYKTMNGGWMEDERDAEREREKKKKTGNGSDIEID